MNLILYKSSCYSFYIHFLCFLIFGNNNNILFIIINFGLLTSILNHGYTNNILKYADRIMMIISALYYLYFIYNINNLLYILLILSILLFLFAKKINDKRFSNISHILSHIALTILNIILIIYYN